MKLPVPNFHSEHS